MSPIENAGKLVERFYTSNIEDILYGLYKKQAVWCAILVAEGIFNELSDLPRIPYNERRTKYWEEVLTELNKLV